MFKFLKKFQTRGIEGNYDLSSDPPKWILGNNRRIGAAVDQSTLTGLAAAYSCVKFISESVGQLPLVLYNRDSQGNKNRAVSHPVYRLLKLAPNSYTSAVVFWETLAGHLLITGNSFSQITTDRKGQTTSLTLLNPNFMRLKFSNQSKKIIYKYQDPISRLTVDINQDDILHVKINCRDGLIGRSPVTEINEAFGLAVMSEQYAARTFAGDATPAGVLEYPGKLTQEKASALRDSWAGFHNSESSRKIAVLEAGMKFTQVQFSPEDAELLESRKFQLEEVARIFEVPPELIGHYGKVTGNLGEKMNLFYRHCLTPILRRIENELNLKVVPASSDLEYFSEFLLDGLLRADPKTRAETNEIYIKNGVYNPNEVRAMENANPRDGGDQYAIPTSSQQSAGATEQIMNPKEPSKAPDPVVKDPVIEEKSSQPGKSKDEIIKFIIREKWGLFARMAKIEPDEGKIRAYFDKLFCGQAAALKELEPESKAGLHLERFYDHNIKPMLAPERKGYLGEVESTFIDFWL